MNTPNHPQSIVVPPEGILLTAVLPALGLTFDQVNPLLGEQLGAPRDYSMPSGAHCLVFNAGGVRRLASLFGIAVEVTEGVSGAVDAAPATSPAPDKTEATADAHGRPRGEWWKRGDLA